MAYHVEGCALCGLSALIRDAAIDPGGREDQYFWCPDVDACAERWLRKYLSGRAGVIESVTQLGRGPSQQAVFEVHYSPQTADGLKKRVLMPEVHPERDHHRSSEHYHLIEFGADVTDSFAG
ncbi:MAG: hypothetical protein EXR47_03830 [Dehalococcoidia bacterium]|nr:hypothetical protein [Dehalococcoidia bacterium]